MNIMTSIVQVLLFIYLVNLCDSITVENSNVTSVNGTYGDVLVAACDPGFTVLHGSTAQHTTCQSNGNWTDVEDCQPVEDGKQLNILQLILFVHD